MGQGDQGATRPGEARVGGPGERNLRCINEFINGKIFSFKLCLYPQIFGISDGPGEL